MTKLPDVPAPGGRLDPDLDFQSLNVAVLTVSDTRTPETDTSGDLLVARIEEAGHKVIRRTILRDDIQGVRAGVKDWIDDGEVDVVISTGGTGLTGRDITPEAVTPLFDKRIEGFVDHAHCALPKAALDVVLGDLGWSLVFVCHFKLLSAQRVDKTVVNSVKSAIAHDDDLVPALTVLQQIVDNALGIGFYLN